MIIKISNESFESVPVFPLKNVQLFPHTILPLNIFEPRYIAMIDYALENDHLITIGDTQFDDIDDEIDEESEQPRIRPILGAGVIIAVNKTEAQRYQILVQGVTRVMMLEELEQTMPFRQVSAEILPDEESDPKQIFQAEDQLRSLLVHFAEENESKAETLYDLLKTAPNAEVLSHMIGANLVSSPTMRQSLFEELNPSRRLEMIYQHIGDLLLQSELEDSIPLH
jgi:hypothetical protein